MIQSGDVIAVGLSGGKDSMTMLYGLKKLQAFYPEKFDLVAIYVDLGIDSNAKQVIPVMEQYCASLQVPFHTIQTQIYPIIFKERKEKNPCSLCAKMRKGALNEYAFDIFAMLNIIIIIAIKTIVFNVFFIFFSFLL